MASGKEPAAKGVALATARPNVAAILVGCRWLSHWYVGGESPMKHIGNRSRSGLIVVTLLALGCVARPSDFAGVTKSRLHLLGILGKAALERQKPLDGVASIADFLELMEVEAEGRFENDEADEWGRP
jgi:hypothetical protein